MFPNQGAATDIGRTFDGDAAGKSKGGRLLDWEGGPSVGPRVLGRPNFGTRWDRRLLPPGLMALPQQPR